LVISIWLASGGEAADDAGGLRPLQPGCSFVVLSDNGHFLLMMAVGSIVGSFIGGHLLGIVPLSFLLPLLGGDLGAVGNQGLAAQIAEPNK
jgi:hypothetical protein